MHLPKVPDLKLDHANSEREHAIKRGSDRTSKSGLQTPLVHRVHMSIGLARFTWGEYCYGEGSWAILQNEYEGLIDVAHSELTSQGVFAQIWQGLNKLSDQNNAKDWINPGQDGEWRIILIDTGLRRLLNGRKLWPLSRTSFRFLCLPRPFRSCCSPRSHCSPCSPSSPYSSIYYTPDLILVSGSEP